MDDDGAGYSWEGAYERTWESGLHEDASGALQPAVRDLVHAAARRKLAAHRPNNVRLTIMRAVFVCIDCSDAMLDKDFQPTRLAVALACVRQFVVAFFEQNPMASLGLLTVRDKRAELLHELSADAARLQAALHALAAPGAASPAGDWSLHNALDGAERHLRPAASHCSKEVVLVLGALATVDPANVYTVVENVKAKKIRCSLMHMACEVAVNTRLCRDTAGVHTVVDDGTSLAEALHALALPPASTASTEASLVQMGFPTHARTPQSTAPSMCNCHGLVVDGDAEQVSFTSHGYFCPRCRSKYCSVPVQCSVCGLMLVSAAQLARCNQHLRPLPQFVERKATGGDAEPTGKRANDQRNTSMSSECDCCAGCGVPLECRRYECATCSSHYCLDCDLLLHDALHVCPMCIV